MTELLMSVCTALDRRRADCINRDGYKQDMEPNQCAAVVHGWDAFKQCAGQDASGSPRPLASPDWQHLGRHDSYSGAIGGKGSKGHDGLHDGEWKSVAEMLDQLHESDGASMEFGTWPNSAR